jgi:hypothetical protein
MWIPIFTLARQDGIVYAASTILPVNVTRKITYLPNYNTR